MAVHARAREADAGGRVLWAPRAAPWWVAVLFMVGSLCFVVAPLPPYAQWVGVAADSTTFFVGSLFFTAAAALQLWVTGRAEQPGRGQRRRSGALRPWQGRSRTWWSSAVQLIGTLFFNATTFRALSTAVGSPSYDRVVWRPDAYGSVCFLVSGALAYLDVTRGRVAWPPRTISGVVAAVNLFGCVAFGLSAVAGYVLPATGALVNATVTNAATCVGALAFFVGAALLLPQPAGTDS